MRSPSSSASARSSIPTPPAWPGPRRSAAGGPLHAPRLPRRQRLREFINREVAALLQGLHIDAFTKSRARRSTDNALVESKNGSVIRKQLGHGHIPSRCAAQVNAFTQQVLSPYLNFHRPCFFPTEQVDARGRVRKRYRDADIMTPYEKLKSLPDAAACLKPGTTFAKLAAVAVAMSDNEAAQALDEARTRFVPVHRPSGLKVCSRPATAACRSASCC